MIPRKAVGTLIATGLVVAAIATANAAPGSKPNGPWVTPNQNISLEAFHSYDQLVSDLFKIQKSSKGLVQLEQAGVSGQGRIIYLVKIGNPVKPSVLIFTQQHGDEPHGTEAALDLISYLGTGSAAARKILDEVHVLIIPRANPDGSEIPTRGNADFPQEPANTGQCPAAGGSNPNGKGIYTTQYSVTGEYSYDMNRYHWADWTQSWQYLCNTDSNGDPVYPDNPVPEALAVLGVNNMYSPIWALDIHNQGFNVVDPDQCAANQACRPGQYVTGSILWPTNDDVQAGALNLSKQVALVLKKRSLEIGNVELTRYSGGDFPGIARNAYGLLGAGSVLFEVVGQIEGSPNINNGQKAIGKLKSGIRKLLVSLLESTADGSLFGQDPNEVDTLILDNDVGLPNPRTEE